MLYNFFTCIIYGYMYIYMSTIWIINTNCILYTCVVCVLFLMNYIHIEYNTRLLYLLSTYYEYCI